jgi:hypothetical protein
MNADAKKRAAGGLLDHVVGRSASQRGERVAVLVIGDAHVEIAVHTNTVPADVVALDRLGLDGLVRQVSCHRVHRVHNHGRCGGLLLKRLLTLFNVGQTLHQRLILFAQLLGLSLDVRELIGLSRAANARMAAAKITESSRRVGAAPLLGDLREKDLHLSSLG